MVKFGFIPFMDVHLAYDKFKDTFASISGSNVVIYDSLEDFFDDVRNFYSRIKHDNRSQAS